MATGEGAKQAMEPANRPIDGVGNNETHPEWGSAGQQLLRLTPAAYADGAAAPAGKFRANPREISNAICAQGDSEPSPQGLSNFIWAWGQFLDHELDLTGPARPTESLNMTAPRRIRNCRMGSSSSRARSTMRPREARPPSRVSS